MTMVEVTFKPREELLERDPRIRKKWADALSSGKYSQCKSELYDGESYCCIGVYGEVVENVDVSDLYQKEYPDLYDFDGLSFEEPIIDADHSVRYEKLSAVPNCVNFADLNDSYNLTFSEIAQIVLGNTFTKEINEETLNE